MSLAQCHWQLPQNSAAVGPSEAALQELPASAVAVQQLPLQAITAKQAVNYWNKHASQGEALPVESTLIAASHSSSTTGSTSYCQPCSRCQATDLMVSCC